LTRSHARRLLVVFGLSVSAAFTYLAVRKVDFDVFWQALRESNYWWLLPALATLAVCVVVRGLRWRFLFTPETRPPLGATLDALLIGLLFNNILPARAGEAMRIVALNQRAGTSRVEALATAATERVYDVLSTLLILFVAAPFLPEVTWIRRAALLAIGLAAAVLAVVVAIRLAGERPVRLLLRPLSLLPGVSLGRTERAASSLVRGLAAIRSPRLALLALVLTTGSWLVLGLSAYFVLRCLDLGVGFGAALLVVVATNLAMVIPSSPAAVGVYEAATQVALRPFGIGDSEALSYAIVLHAVNFLPYLVVGYAVLHRHALLLRRRPATEELGSQ